MHPVFRATLLVCGFVATVQGGRAQAEALPPIFAPRAARAPSGSEPAPPPAALPVSSRTRALILAMSERRLADATVFSAPGLEPEVTTAYASVAGGVTVMKPLVVRARGPGDSEVRRPIVETFRARPLGPDSLLNVAGGVTMPLFHRYLGSKEFQVDFSVVNSAGRGLDLRRDFTRVQIGFTFKW